MNLTNEEYAALVKRSAPRSPLAKDMAQAFWIGGLICCVGQGLTDAFTVLGAAPEDAGTWCSITLVFLGALLTGIGVYDRIARAAGAGTLVPITGFSNAVVSPALEFRAEGLITGTARDAVVDADAGQQRAEKHERDGAPRPRVVARCAERGEGIRQPLPDAADEPADPE